MKFFHTHTCPARAPRKARSRWKGPAALLLALGLSASLSAQEICNNGVDDDGDGLIDLNDPECLCSTLLAGDDVQSYIRNPSFEDRLDGTCCPFGFVSPFSWPWMECAAGWHQATEATPDYMHPCGYAPAGMPLPPPDGEGAVGFCAMSGWFEYVGTCLTAHPLLAGTTYTLSLWVAGAATNDQHTQTPEQGQAIGTLFPDRLPLAIFGHASCAHFPIGTVECIGDMPGWQELGHVMVQPSWDWIRVSITFTPAEDIHSIVIGSACDLPASFAEQSFTDSQGVTKELFPYFLVDDLMLTTAQDQVVCPVTTTGNLCTNDASAIGDPPAQATDLQWYRDGVALPGETDAVLAISEKGYGPGLYTLSCSTARGCLRGSSYVAPATPPAPAFSLFSSVNCVPLTVSLADLSGAGTTAISWDMGDGNVLPGSDTTYTYTTPGSYDVALTVRNGVGCTATELVADAVVARPSVEAHISAMPSVVDLSNTLVHLESSGTGDIRSWWWDLGDADPSTSDQRSLDALFPGEVGDHPVTLVVGTADECRDTAHFVITVVQGLGIQAHGLSDGGHWQNGRFIPPGQGRPGLFEVYDLWGRRIFGTRNLAQGWNPAGVPDGAYFYVVTPDDPSGSRCTGRMNLLK
ncbi:MAG: PKD domain-containing protein [Flavobacteriales bacterium]